MTQFERIKHKDQEPQVKHSDITRYGNWLIVDFSCPLRVLSWAVCGGGMTKAKRVAWRKVHNSEFDQCTHAENFLQEQFDCENITDAVGLLTSANLDAYVDMKKSFGSYSARCIATVGMGNALCVGDPPTAGNYVGTINLVCLLSVPLSEGAFIEAVSIAAEARTLAVLKSGIESSHTKFHATGTGTDCIVIAAPDATNGRKYAGKHTVIGHLIGSSVSDAVALGIERWKADKSKKSRGPLE